MKVYQKDKDGFYVGEVIASPDPLEPEKFLIPGGCVQDAPPVPGDKQTARRVGEEWQIVPDMVGVEYWDVDGKPQKIGKRGEGLPEGASLVEPEAVKAARLVAESNAAALAELLDIDLKSIRAMREYIAAKADAPQFIKNHEAAAQAARAKLA